MWELDGRTSELERKRGEVRESSSASRQGDEGMEDEYRRERAMHGRSRRLAFMLGLVATLLVICGLLT